MNIRLKKMQIYVEEVWLITILVIMLSQHARIYFLNYFSCYLFIAFHEFSHTFVASILGIYTNKIYIRLSGLNIEIPLKHNCYKEIAIYFAGPLANMLLAIMLKKIPMVFEINIALCAINMLPVYPLDGYNILQCLLKNIKNKEKICIYVRKSVTVLMLSVGLLMFKIYQNPSIILMAVYIIIIYKYKHKNSV